MSDACAAAADDVITCQAMVLPDDLLVPAAAEACAINPANDIMSRWASLVSDDLIFTPQRISVLTSRYWGPSGVKLGVTFMDTADAALKARILSHMNAWGSRCNVRFGESAQGEVRITRTPGGGHWSYLGTDVRMIPTNQPTMNLDSFSMSTPESEYRRVVRHETGHTLGSPHEHMRADLVALLDPQKTIAYFQRTYGWSAQTTQQQVLTPINERSLMGTPVDRLSIMCYQLPGACTKSGQPIPGGLDIDETDYAFMAKLYPLPVAPPPPVSPPVSPPPPPPPVKPIGGNGGNSMLSKDLLKVIIDEVFKVLITNQSGHPFTVAVLKYLNRLVGDTLIDLILDRLGAQGVPVAATVPLDELPE